MSMAFLVVLERLGLPWSAFREHLVAAIERHGHIPLPPYIKRDEGEMASDRDRYQTVFASTPGAVASRRGLKRRDTICASRCGRQKTRRARAARRRSSTSESDNGW